MTGNVLVGQNKCPVNTEATSKKWDPEKNQNIRSKKANLPLLEYGENVKCFLLLLEYNLYSDAAMDERMTIKCVR